MTMKSFCDNRGSIFNIITLGKKLINLFIQDIFYYIVQVICTWLYKSDFVMAIIAQVSDVAYRLLVIPPIEWNLEYYVKPTINILSDKCKNCSLPILIVENNLNYNVKKKILKEFAFCIFLISYFFLDVTLLTLHTEDVVAISSVPFINIGIEYLKILHSNQTEISDSRKGSRINIKILTCFHCLKVHFRLMLKKCYMRPLYNNRTELIAPNTSLAAVMIIKNPICWDEGTYRCWIVYFFRGLKKKSDQRFCCRI